MLEDNDIHWKGVPLFLWTIYILYFWYQSIQMKSFDGKTWVNPICCSFICGISLLLFHGLKTSMVQVFRHTKSKRNIFGSWDFKFMYISNQSLNFDPN